MFSHRWSFICLHGYENAKPQRVWGHDIDLLGSRDVIGHVTIGLAVSTFLLMVMMTMCLFCTFIEI